MKMLLEPWSIRQVTFPNRIAVSPMCQYSSVDGLANDWHLVHLGSRAVGGAGLVMVEATSVTENGRITPEDLGLWNDGQIEPLRRITRFITAQGGVPGIQLCHAGRKASSYRPWVSQTGTVPEQDGGWQPVGPSAVAFGNYAQPTPLTEPLIQDVIAAFVTATKRAINAGFKVIEVHAAHGYLLHQFLSPLSNKRTDRYGSSYENRVRLTLEVTKAVREVWPEEFPLFVRLSATDWEEGGWDIEETIELAKQLKALGVDLIDTSSGGMTPTPTIPVGPGYQTGFAARIRTEAEIATGTVGMITEPAQAEHILRTGQADMVLLARELLRDPYWALHADEQFSERTIVWPSQYQRATHRDQPVREVDLKD
jgi:2,4-dienoyl-CoA reductase-like NADH-dependent reductase (Old Yellow Enzyme family)